MGLADLEKDLGAPPVDAALTVGRGPGSGGIAALEADLKAPPPPAAAEPSTAMRVFNKGRDVANWGMENLLSGFTVNELRPRLTNPLINAPPEQTTEATQAINRNAITPQTPMQAGMMAGTMAAGPLAGAAGKAGVPILGALAKYPALSRILGGAAGGEAGNQVEGGPMGYGAAVGGISNTVGEGVGALGSKLIRSLPGMKERIAGQDAAKYTAEMGRQSPPLAGASTVQDLQRLAGGEGRDVLGQAKEAAVQHIERMLPIASPAARIDPVAERALRKQMGLKTGEPLPAWTQTAEGLRGPAGAPSASALVTVPSLSENPMPLRDANEALSKLGARAFSKNPLERTINGVDQRELYGQIAGEISADLHAQNPKAGALWDQTQDQYKSGLAFLRPAEATGAYRINARGTQFNTPHFQQYVQSPKKMAAMGTKLGDADFEALRNILTRGAGEGKDVLVPGTSNIGQAAMEMLRGKGGATQLFAFGPRTAFPNFGSEYAGRAPYSLPPALQQILDMATQRHAGQMGGRD